MIHNQLGTTANEARVEEFSSNLSFPILLDQKLILKTKRKKEKKNEEEDRQTNKLARPKSSQGPFFGPRIFTNLEEGK